MTLLDQSLVPLVWNSDACMGSCLWKHANWSAYLYLYSLLSLITTTAIHGYVATIGHFVPPRKSSYRARLEHSVNTL